MLLFAGEAFHTDGEHQRLRSLLTGWSAAWWMGGACRGVGGASNLALTTPSSSSRLFQRSHRVEGAAGRLGTCSALHGSGREGLHAKLQVGAGGGPHKPAGPDP